MTNLNLDIRLDYTHDPHAPTPELIAQYIPWIRTHLERERTWSRRNPIPFDPLVLDWAYHTGLWRQQEIGWLNDYGIPLLIALSYPEDISPALRLLLNQYYLIPSALDDKVGESGRPLDVYLQSMPVVLRTGIMPADADAFHRACLDLREGIRREGGEALLPEFADSVEQFIQAWQIEQRWRSENLPTLAEYLDLRKVVINVYSGILLARLHPAMPAPDQWLPASVTRLTWQVCQIIAIENDLFSAYKEAQQGTVLTLFNVISREYGVDLPHAMVCALAIRAALRIQCNDLISDILSESLPEPVHRYARLVFAFIDNFYEWQINSSRYDLARLPANGETALPHPAC